MGFFDKKIKKEDSSNIIGTKKIDDEQLDLPPLPKNLGNDFSEQKRSEPIKNTNNFNNSPHIFSDDERTKSQLNFTDEMLNVDELRTKPNVVQTPQRTPPDNVINNYRNDQQQAKANNTPNNDIRLTSPGATEEKMNNDSFLFSDDFSSNDTKVLGGEEIITNPEYKEQLQREAMMNNPKQFNNLRPFTKEELNQNERKVVVNLDETIAISEKVPNKQTFLKEEYITMRKKGYNYIGFSSFRKIASLINGFPADLKVVDDVSKQQITINEDLNKEYLELEKNLESLERDLIKLDKLIFEQ